MVFTVSDGNGSLLKLDATNLEKFDNKDISSNVFGFSSNVSALVHRVLSCLNL